MMRLSRRTFVQSCIALPIASRIAAAISQGAQHVYVVESVELTGINHCVIGCLITTTPDGHRRALREAYARTNFHRVFTYHGTDRQKISCAREMMHYFAHAQDLRFVSRVLKGVPRREVRRTLVAQYAALLKQADVGRAAVVHLKARPRGRPFRHGPEQQADRISAVESLVASVLLVGRRKADPLMDLAAALNGTLFGEVRGVAAQPKMALQARLRALLDVRSLETQVQGKWEATSAAAATERAG